MAYIVGSVARSEARRLSDIDIVLVDPSLPEGSFIDIGCTEIDKHNITRILENLGMMFTVLEIEKIQIEKKHCFAMVSIKIKFFTFI